MRVKVTMCECEVLKEVRFYTEGKPKCNICDKSIEYEKLKYYVSNMPEKEWNKLFDERNRGKEFVITRGK